MKPLWQISTLLVVMLVIAAPADAKGYVLADRGNCVTVEFHYDANGNFIGSSSSNSACPSMPDGVYPFRLMVNSDVTKPTPLDPRSGNPLAATAPTYRPTLTAVASLRDILRNPGRFRKITISREYSTVIERGLVGAAELAVSVPPGYFPTAFEKDVERIKRSN